MNILKKISIFSILLGIIFLTSCGGTEKTEKSAVLDDDSDKNIKVAIVVDKGSNESIVSKSILENKAYQRENGNNTNSEYVSYSLDSGNIKKIFDKIGRDKKINALVVSSKSKDVLKEVKALKDKRNDIVFISSNSDIDEKNLSTTFDISFVENTENKGKRIVDLAKSIGADKFFALTSGDDQSVKSTLNAVKSEAQKLNLPYEEVEIDPTRSDYEKKADVSNKIDELTNEYGSNINIYPTKSFMDEVVVNKFVEKKFLTSELSNPSSSDLLASSFLITQLPRLSFDYNTKNTQITSFLNNNYGIERMMGSVESEEDSFMLRFSIELATVLASKGYDIDKAYNSYFLEKVALERCKVSSGFINVENHGSKVKEVRIDQLVY